MIRSLMVIILTMVASSTFSQQTKYKSLKVGDEVPDVTLVNMLNYRRPVGKLSDFRGKLVIIDFWSAGCLSCIDAFPKMQRLQDEFNGNIQVLLVTNNTSKELKKFFDHSDIFKNIRLPFVIGDIELYRLFPHTGEPYHVWIDSLGIVRALTSGHNATPDHIAAFLSGRPADLSPATDIVSLDIAEPYKSFLQSKNVRPLQLTTYYSLFAKHIGIKTDFRYLLDSASKKLIGVRYMNTPLLRFCKEAYEFDQPDDRVIFDLDNAEQFIEPKDENKEDEWMDKNCFCYELKLPARFIDSSPEDSYSSQMKLRNEMRGIERQDLARVFGIEGRIERRKLACWALVRIDSTDRLKSRGGDMVVERALGIYRNMPLVGIINFVSIANRDAHPHPFLNETGYKDDTFRIDMDLKVPLDDISAVRTELHKYGLDLVEKEEELEVLVLRKSADNEDN